MAEKRVAVTYSDPQKLEPYAAALRLAGLVPVLNPETLDGLEALLLTGGIDVNPLRYGAEPHANTDPPDDERDEREMRLLDQAQRADMPVLAICRGLQLFNVAHGGTLVQDLANGSHQQRGVADAHAIAIELESRLAAIVGRTDITVNSRHHQAVDRVGSGLLVTARCPSDGVVEAIENRSCRFAVAVQWHPEDRSATHDADRRLFEAFAKAIAENRR